MKPCVMLGLIILGFSQPAEGQLVIGTFDEARGGIGSLFSANSASDLLAVQTNYPCATVTASPSLTPEFMSGVDVLWITAVFGSTDPIIPLSASEQSALSDHISAGGGALLFTDNDSQFFLASQSFLVPFGLVATGTVLSGDSVTVTSPTSTPVTDGPFGLVTNYTVSFPGWYIGLGTAQGLATLDSNGETTLAWIPPGQISPSAGGIVFFSDYANSVSSEALKLNSISAVGGKCISVPAISDWGLAVMTLLILAVGTVVSRYRSSSSRA
jgi:hypothetical protein